MSLAGILTPLATTLLTQFGEAITFTRQVQGDYDPETAETIPGGSVTYTAYGAPENYQENEINNVNILKGDSKLTIYKTTQLPVVDDTCTMNGIDYRVINVERIRAQGFDIVYVLQVRV